MKRIALTVLALTALASCSQPTAPRPNILFITIDTLRADYLTPYGYQDPSVSPTVAGLASQGVVFEHVSSTAGTTLPSHSSMFTGLYARVHGARSNFHGLYDGVRTVTQALHDVGYQTGGFVSNQFLFTIARLDRGFDAINAPFTDSDKGKPQSGSKTVAEAIEWVDGIKQSRPSFMWLHLWEPHGPHDLTDWAQQRMGDYDGPLKDGITLEQIRQPLKNITNNSANIQALRTLYAGEVNLADHYLGQLLDHLRESGWLNNAVVIFTADHGQTLGENRHMGHGPTLRETVLHVPLIIVDYRHPAASRVAARVGTIDIAPTIADYAGLDEHFDYVGRSLTDPRSLADDWPYLAEVALREETDRNWERVKNNSTYDAAALAAYHGPWKLIYHGGEYRMLKTGCKRPEGCPLEESDQPAIAENLRGLIDQYQQIDIDRTEGSVSEEDLRTLQGLGYTQ